MGTYRVNFLKNIEVDYWGNNKKKLQAESYLNFNVLHQKYYFIIKEIKMEAKTIGIKYIWHFYEPYIEITWFGNKKQSERLFRIVEKICNKNNITDLQKLRDGEGFHADWFCCNNRETEFGGKRHAICSDFASLINEYENDIRSGKGVNEQVKRTIHTICNPLGINYTDEAKICFSRGLICVLFRFFEFKKAVWIYKNIFRQKY